MQHEIVAPAPDGCAKRVVKVTVTQRVDQLDTAGGSATTDNSMEGDGW
jgi:hypothetical protein